jgi:hypothetical protein
MLPGTDVYLGRVHAIEHRVVLLVLADQNTEAHVCLRALRGPVAPHHAMTGRRFRRLRDGGKA